MIRERLRARGLPEDLVYLTLIESGLFEYGGKPRPSRWNVAVHVGDGPGIPACRYDAWVDERRDPFKADGRRGPIISRTWCSGLGSVYLAPRPTMPVRPDRAGDPPPAG